MTLDKQQKKELATAYKQSFRPMGVYQIRNTENGKVLVGSSMDLDGMNNRLAFAKQLNSNMFTELKEDWSRYGGNAFVFEVLDRIKPRDEQMNDPSELEAYKEEVETLLELWLDKLQPYGERGYNKPKRK